MSTTTSASAMSMRRARSRLPSRLQIQREGVDAAEVLDRLPTCVRPSASGSSPSASTAAAVNSAKPPRWARPHPSPLSSRWTRMTSEPASSSRAGDPAADECRRDGRTALRSRRGASRHELQSQLVAWSMLRSLRRNAMYAASIASSSERSVGTAVLDEEERCIAFELGQSERRFRAADDRLEQVTGDGRRVLDLASRQIGGVAGQVRDDEESGLWRRWHGANRRPWSRSNVNTERRVH